jgi:hypothetical protein
MNDLPQNELLSAYLDGELTAAEQAEVERLLASSPAARQLLDELRTLSATLQSLPQQKLGEDLSQQVLRVAERRMLTEGEPNDAAPVPASRTLLRRFVTRRSVIWTGLAVAIAVMIAIHEQQQNTAILANKAKQADKTEVALGRVDRENRRMSETSASESATVPTIQAAPSSQPVPYTVAKKSSADKKLLATKGRESKTERFAVTPGAKQGMKPRGEGAEQNINWGVLPAQRQGEGSNVAVAPIQVAPLAAAPAPPGLHQMDKAAGPMGKAGAYGGKDGPGGSSNWYDHDGSAPIGPDVLLVFCDISPDAKKKAFDKVLASNGIVSRRHVESVELRKKIADRDDYGQGAANAKAAAEEVLKKRLPSGAVVLRKAVAGNAELVYVEATPDQIKATLAGFAAQPKVFVSVSVKSAQDEAARRQVVRYYAVIRDESRTANRLSDALGKSFGQEGFQNAQKAPQIPAKPREVALADRAAHVTAKKGDMTTLGGGRDEKRLEVAHEPTRDKSKKMDSNKAGHGTDAAPRPNDAPSIAAGTATRPSTPALASPSSGKPQSRTDAIAQHITPKETAVGVVDESQPKRQAGGQTSLHYAQSALRQRVLFVIRIGDGPPPLASKAEAKAAEEAKQAPATEPAEPAPSKQMPSKE